MLYYVDRTCTDFSGRLFVEGETVELPEGRHNAHLIPVPAEEPVAETPEPEEAAEETEEEPVEEPAPAPKKTSRKKAATTTEAEG